jgi:hypothetical protein
MAHRLLSAEMLMPSSQDVNCGKRQTGKRTGTQEFRRPLKGGHP